MKTSKILFTRVLCTSNFYTSYNMFQYFNCTKASNEMDLLYQKVAKNFRLRLVGLIAWPKNHFYFLHCFVQFHVDSSELGPGSC